MKKVFSLVLSGALMLAFSAQPFAAAAVPMFSAEESTDAFSGEDQVIFSGFTLSQGPSAQFNRNKDAYNYGFYEYLEDDTYDSKLDANNAAVYAAFTELITPSTDPITIALPNPITFYTSSPTQSGFSETDKETYKNAVASACQSGADAALFDIPELFWLEESRIGINTYQNGPTYSYSKKKYKFTITALVLYPNYYQVYNSLEEVEEYRRALGDAANNYILDDTSASRYDKLRYIHDQICYNTSYLLDAPFSSSCIGSLVEHEVVCEGYSEGFKYICDLLDIPCVCVFGNLDVDTNIGHMWNYVQMDDGKWYAVDVTWDDYDGYAGKDIVYTYFLKGSRKFNTDHSENEYYGITYFDYPDIAVDDYDPNNVVTTTTTTTTTTTSSTSTTTTTEDTTTSTTTTTEDTTASTTTTTEDTTAPTTTTTEDTTTSTTTTAEDTTTSTTTTTEDTTTSTTTTTEGTTTSTTTTTEDTTTSTTTVTEPPEPDYSSGDIDQDGETTIADLVSLLNGLLGRKGGTAADVNSSGRADVFDAIILRRIIFLKPRIS